MKVQYIANDGKIFETEKACREHEEATWKKLFLRLKETDIDAALARENIPLAEAFERMGRLCGDARRDAGEFKRRPKTIVEPPATEPGPASETAPDQAKGGDDDLPI
jgi:hypothetical protein